MSPSHSNPGDDVVFRARGQAGSVWGSEAQVVHSSIADKADCARSVSDLRNGAARSVVDGGQGGAAEEGRQDEAAGRRTHGRVVLGRLQGSDEMRQLTLRSAADQPRAQGGLAL